jgi:hypothetical protein
MEANSSKNMIQRSEEKSREASSNTMESFRQSPGASAHEERPTSNFANQVCLVPSKIVLSNDNNPMQIVPSRMTEAVKIDGPRTPVNTGFLTETEMSKCPLPLHFAPGPFDVICAKGNNAKNHPGNSRLRKFVDTFSEDYGNATSRVQKTIMVNQIIHSVRSVNGCFVKFENVQWHDVGDAMAREKVGQSLRERNHSLYRSSNKAKRKKKKEFNDKISDHVKSVMTNNNFVAAGVHQLASALEEHRGTTTASSTTTGGAQAADDNHMRSSDESNLELAMTKANSRILASLKKDQSIQNILKEEDEETKKTSGAANDQGEW